MAESHTIPGTQVQVKAANPVGVGFLSLTGVYIPFFWYRINRELKELGEARGWDLGSSPGTSTAAMFPGFLVLVPPFVTAYSTNERIKNAQMYTGRRDWIEGWIALLMYFLLAPVMFGFAQDQLNKVWQNLGMPTPYEKEILPPPAPGYYPAQQPYGQPQGYVPPPPAQGYGGQPPAQVPPPPGNRPPEPPPA